MTFMQRSAIDGAIVETHAVGNAQIVALGAVPFSQSNPAVGTASAQVLAENKGRRYLLIQNKDAAVPVYVAFGAAATVAGGIRIDAGGAFEALVVPTNAISLIAEAANANVVVVEG